MTGAVLAGGENRRIPVLKSFLTVGGKPIIERSIEVLKRVFQRIVINTNLPERYFSLGLPMIADIRREKGPMTGILSVLTSTEDDAVFVVACDMPFINENLIRYMAERYGEHGSRNYDAVVPVFKGRKEPLFGIYTKGAAKAMDVMIQSGKRSLTGMLESLIVMYISEEDVRSVDSGGESFVNINTMEDYERIGGKECLA